MIELLSPAGNMERLIMAFNYGADAVYIGGKSFGLRASADNFTFDEIEKAVDYAHSLNKKVYFTVNVFARNDDIDSMGAYIRQIDGLGMDAFIVSDPGVLSLIKENAPDAEIHISTQANITNYKAACFWFEQGAKRAVLARELSFDEIKYIRAHTPAELELEAFVHGAMCIAYSGRCLISSFLTQRPSNLGQCVQACRWDFEIREKGKDNGYMTLSEDEKGSYILNSMDLNMIRHIDELAESGITSFKIEGRMKTAYYTSIVTRAYRFAIDDYLSGKSFDEALYAETLTASHRAFSEGFYYNDPHQQLDSSKNIQSYSFIAVVLEYDQDKKEALIEQRNHFKTGDTVEIVSTGRTIHTFSVGPMETLDGTPQVSAPHPQQILRIKCGVPLKKYDIWRKKL